VTHGSLSARHRADGPASTPIDQLTIRVGSALTSPTAARGGLTLVVSSGLVAGAALSAEAAPRPPASVKVAGSSAAHRAHLAHLAHLAHRAHVARHGAAVAQGRSRTSASRSATRSSISGRAGVVGVASRYLGVPYRYGGSTPRGFDCSGFVQYVYGRLGIRLPRTAQQQYNATRHIARSQARPGDLVFFFVGGRVTHVGIYAGGNMMIAAPHSGQVVHKQRIYSANVAFGRV
jgi:cell wall-associated NlpC family hydrolase